MSTTAFSIKGINFEVAAPYAAGYALNEAEAKGLNKLRQENIGNIVRKHVDDILAGAGTDEEKAAAAQALVAAKDAEYAFSIRTAGGGRRVTDPLEKEINAVAKEYLRQKLAEKGKTFKEMGEEWLEEKLTALVANEKIVAVAKKRIAERSKLADIDI